MRTHGQKECDRSTPTGENEAELLLLALARRKMAHMGAVAAYPSARGLLPQLVVVLLGYDWVFSRAMVDTGGLSREANAEECGHMFSVGPWPPAVVVVVLFGDGR